MKLQVVSAIFGFAASTLAGQCKLSLSEFNIQGVSNPDGTNTSGYQVDGTFTYADGSTYDFVPEGTPATWDGECFWSELPHYVCVTSGSNLKEGWMNYSDEHADFNSEYCEQYHNVDPFSAFNSVECQFEC